MPHMLNRQAPASVLSIVLALAMANAPGAPRAVNAQTAARRTLFDRARVIVQEVDVVPPGR